MSRYIDAEQIHYENVEFAWGIAKNMTTKKDVDRVPTADVALVVHAHWIFINGLLAPMFKCSHCRNIAFNSLYCPSCGAKMDAEEDPKK